MSIENIMASSVIKQELEDLKKRVKLLIPIADVVACYQANVQIKIVKTPYKQLLCQFQFPSNYPDAPILLELKSKTFSPKVLAAMSQLADAESKKILGKPQIITLTKLLSNFICDNPLLVCSEEISQIKKKLVKEEDEFKVKQKTGVINYMIKAKKYFFHLKLTVPVGYPAESLEIEFKGSNFPAILEAHFLGQAKEIARQCVQPPLRKDPKAGAFEPKPSLYPVLEYLAGICIHHFPYETCPCCMKPALTDEPEECETNPNAPMFVEWVYCKHVYHHKCLDEYMQTPPFTGGKKCPKCGARIYHEKWNISPELAENRWAHKEARQRELDDVSEFLDLM